MALKYYTNETLNESLATDPDEKTVVDFIRTRDGETNIKSFYARNESNHSVTLKPFAEDNDMHFLQYPKTLGPDESGLVELAFSPPAGREEPLKAEWGFEIDNG